jgi:hypothetical protein
MWNLDKIYQAFKGCPKNVFHKHINTKILEDADINLSPEPNLRQQR